MLGGMSRWMCRSISDNVRAVVGCDDGDAESEGFWVGAGVVDRGLDDVIVRFPERFSTMSENLVELPFAYQSAMPETLEKEKTSENLSKAETASGFDTLWRLLDSKFGSLGIPGAVVLIGVNAIKDDPSNWRKGLVWCGVAAGVWLVIEIAKRLRPHGEKLLDWCFSLPQRLWLQVTDRFQSRYYQRLVYDCREYEGRGFNAGALKLENVYVPLKLVEKSSANAKQNIINLSQPLQQQRDIGKLISDLSGKSASCRRLVILGAPGSGKSTLLRHVTLMYALYRHRHIGHGVPDLIPVLFRLRDMYQDILDKPDSLLVDIVENAVKKLQPTDPLVVRPKWFAKHLAQGKCLVMLDGLDEIPEDDDRAKVSKWVDTQLGIYREVKFILTSRPDAYRRAPLRTNVIESEVQPLSQAERDHFIRNWCRNWRRSQTSNRLDVGEKDKIERASLDLIAQIDGVPSLRLMATNPLLLVLMAKTYSEKGVLSKRRVDIYKDVCQVLLEGRSRLFRDQSKSNRLSAEKKQEFLQILAFQMTEQEKLQFTLTNVSTTMPVFSEAVSVLDSELARVPNNRLSALDFITKDEIGVRELVSDRQQEEIYEFAHRTFQEYLTAVEIKRLGNPEEIISRVFSQGDKAIDWWREVILFYAAQTSATPILKAALEKPSIAALSLAYECIGLTEDIDSSVRIQLEEVVEKNLVSNVRTDFVFAAGILLDLRIQKLNPNCTSSLEIDPSSIDEIRDEKPLTIAEYHLALYETTISEEFLIENIGQPKKPYCQSNLEAGNRYCAWLMKKTAARFLQNRICYRPTWDDSGELHLVRFLIPELYYQLAQLLFTGEWEAADRETYRLMITNPVVGKKEGDWFDREDFFDFPCADLLVIDQLWVKASNGHFGFSVQKKIWEECGSPMDYSYSKEWDEFVDRVSWRRNGKFLDRLGRRKDGKGFAYVDFPNDPILPLAALPRSLGFNGGMFVGVFFSHKSL
jgi:energy-coupling factor transporter ATP-binding protein EcfA2